VRTAETRRSGSFIQGYVLVIKQLRLFVSLVMHTMLPGISSVGRSGIHGGSRVIRM
jgi:hypothetical protein